MALSSSSTYATALAQVNDNLAFEGDVAKARLFLEGVRWLRINRPQQQSGAAKNLQWAQLDKLEKEAQALVKADSITAKRVYFQRGRPM